MSKKLSEMTLEELWQLFPIILTEHKDCWEKYYADEAAGLKKLLPEDSEINHVGSTAVKGIWAKPIVDILAEVDEAVNLSEVSTVLQDNGWIKMSEIDRRISFNKGYTENGFAEKVFHLHLRYAGDNNELYFRDFLIAHPEIAKEYEILKLGLWKKFEHDRDGYTSAKGEFVKKYTMLAKQPMKIREMKQEEFPLLDKFLYEAIFVPKGVEPPSESIIYRPELQVYVSGFGESKHDIALVAEVAGKVAGAVWVRIMNDYGHVDDNTPSFAISVLKEYRGLGIGTALMSKMLETLKERGYAQASLSVQKANYAAQMYSKLGFEVVSENEEEFLMVKKLK